MLERVGGRFCGFSIKNGQRPRSRENALSHWGVVGLPACTRDIWLSLLSESLVLLLNCHREKSILASCPASGQHLKVGKVYIVGVTNKQARRAHPTGPFEGQADGESGEVF